MDNLRFLHCSEIYTDTNTNMNDVRRLSDGRLFTVGLIGKVTNGGKYSCAPSDQFLMGRVSADEGRSWQISFVKQLPESTALTITGDFLIDRDGFIHIFFLHIYSMDPGFKDSLKLTALPQRGRILATRLIFKLTALLKEGASLRNSNHPADQLRRVIVFLGITADLLQSAAPRASHNYPP